MTLMDYDYDYILWFCYSVIFYVIIFFTGFPNFINKFLSKFSSSNNVYEGFIIDYSNAVLLSSFDPFFFYFLNIVSVSLIFFLWFYCSRVIIFHYKIRLVLSVIFPSVFYQLILSRFRLVLSEFKVLRLLVHCAFLYNNAYSHISFTYSIFLFIFFPVSFSFYIIESLFIFTRFFGYFRYSCFLYSTYFYIFLYSKYC